MRKVQNKESRERFRKERMRIEEGSVLIMFQPSQSKKWVLVPHFLS